MRRIMGTILFPIFIILLSTEHISCGRHHYRIYGKHPVSVRHFYSPHARSAQHNHIVRNVSHHHMPGMLNDEEADFNKEIMMAPEKDHIAQKNRPCIRCPPEQTAYASEGMDGVLIDPPAPISCKTNLPFASNLYVTETLFGPNIKFVLPQGRHSLIAKIRDFETGIIVGSCHLKYNVIVHRCKFPMWKNRRLSMYCTAETVWGSKCAFECKRDNEYLTHDDSIYCNEQLEWVGKPPGCIRQLDNQIQETYEPEVNLENEIPCALPNPLSNGQFKCNAIEKKTDDENYQSLAHGSICVAECNENHSIPYFLQPFAVIECKGGAWNSTMDMELCYVKTQPHRLSRLRRTRN